MAVEFDYSSKVERPVMSAAKGSLDDQQMPGPNEGRSIWGH